MFNEKKKAENLLRNGFDRTLSLDKSMFLLAKYFKYLNYTEEECNVNISSWLKKQVLHVSYETALERKEHRINVVYERDYRFIDDINVTIYLEEMQKINELKTRGQRKVAFAFLYLSKIYANGEGIFYCSYKVLSQLSNVSEFFIINNISKIFEDNGYIKFVARDVINKVFNCKSNGVTKVYKKSNKYKISYCGGKTPLINIGDVDNLEPDFIRAYNMCVEKYDFKIIRRFKEYLKNNS